MSDLVKDLTQYRISGIEKAEVEYYQSLTRTLDKIEDQIISLASKELPTQAGQLMELQSAVALRPKIKAILDKEYLPFADRVVRKGFGEQAKRVERQFKTLGIIPPQFRELTKSDLALIKNLKQQYFTQFKDVSNNFTRILSDKVYQNTLVGNSFVELEEELRQSINGIYSTSNDPAVNRLVNYVKTNQNNPALKARVNLAIQQLQTKYARTRTGENMRRYAGQILNDSLRDFDATLNFNKAKDACLKFVKYYGDVIGTTRDLCRRMINGDLNKRENGVFSIDEIKEIWRGRSWSGKKSGNPLTVRGGYNCRHQFSYVNPDWYEDDGEESQILKTRRPIVKKEQNANISSLANPITLTAIRPVSIKESKLRLQKQIDQNFQDKRYPKNPDGSLKTRFRNVDKNAGRVEIRGLNEQEATLVTAIFDELNELAVKYNVPKLRGLKITPVKSYNGAMGDGILHLSSRFINNNTALGKLKTTKWKYGDDPIKRPFSVKAYRSDPVDRIRSTMYHEFGHHIHQMKYVNNNSDYGFRFTPLIEKKVAQLIKDERRKVPFAKRLIGNSEYGDTNPHEWFAEQFSAYTFGMTEKVHPSFIKLIKEIEDEVDR